MLLITSHLHLKALKVFLLVKKIIQISHREISKGPWDSLAIISHTVLSHSIQAKFSFLTVDLLWTLHLAADPSI